jgi:beta-glucosidase
MPTFPDDFLWGTATAAYSVEGAVAEDGRGESIWDRFCRQPGRIADGSTGAVAADHYRRWPKDIELMARLGIKAYRFSIAWPRLFPEGGGRLNRKGLDFYERLVDGVLEAGIRPWAVLYHWDLPQELEFRGGWRSRDTARRFVDYACTAADRLGDRIQHWLPVAGVATTAWMGHATGRHAPGLAERRAFCAALHHLNLAQGLAIGALRRENARWLIGAAIDFRSILPADDTQGAADAAFLADALLNGSTLDPLMTGKYPEVLADGIRPFTEDRDLDTVRQPVDFIMLDHAGQGWAAPDRDAALGFTLSPKPPGATERTATAGGGPLRDLLAALRDRFDNPLVYLGATGPDAEAGPDANGNIRDARIGWAEEYFSALADAIAAGCDVRGCFLWPLLDGFQWDEGYERRPGLVHVDRRSLERTPKDSYRWYTALVRENRF